MHSQSTLRGFKSRPHNQALIGLQEEETVSTPLTLGRPLTALFVYREGLDAPPDDYLAGIQVRIGEGPRVERPRSQVHKRDFPAGGVDPVRHVSVESQRLGRRLATPAPAEQTIGALISEPQTTLKGTLGMFCDMTQSVRNASTLPRLGCEPRACRLLE